MADAVSATPETSEQTGLPTNQPANNFLGTKHKVKIDGNEQEVTYEDLLSGFQQKSASTKRWEEASKMRKDVESLFDSMSKGDMSFLKQVLPPDTLRKWAEKELLDYIEYEKLSPAEKAKITAEKERDDAKRQVEELTKSQREALQQQVEHQAGVEIEQEIIDAVKSLGHDVKVTPRLIRRIAEQMNHSLKVSDDPNAQHMPAKIAAERAWRGLRKDFEEYIGLSKPEDFIAMLPRKLRDAIRKADVESAISQMPTRSVRNSNQTSEPASTSREPKLRRMSTDEWFNRIGKTLNKRG